MEIKERVEAFDKLSKLIADEIQHNEFHAVLAAAKAENGWFTEDSVRNSLSSWVSLLDKENVYSWLQRYEGKLNVDEKTIGIIMAGNVPLVGFHDVLCTAICGHRVSGKVSSDDTILTTWVLGLLKKIAPDIASKITLTDGKLENIEAVIATGSNNTSRYFEHYFGKYPNVIRKNRNAIAILKGNETVDELRALGIDIFTYFGLGCRNVSKLFIPQGYDFTLFFESIEEFKIVIDHHKYANNYNYNRTVFLMQDAKLWDNNFLILKEEKATASPIGTLFFEYYEDENHLLDRLSEEKGNIQCVVSGNDVPFGKAQHPQLSDYADGVDTMDFLLSL